MKKRGWTERHRERFREWMERGKKREIQRGDGERERERE